jgi:hypothetical protein
MKKKTEMISLFIFPSKTNSRLVILHVLEYLCDTCLQSHASADMVTIYIYIYFFLFQGLKKKIKF